MIVSVTIAFSINYWKVYNREIVNQAGVLNIAFTGRGREFSGRTLSHAGSSSHVLHAGHAQQF